MSRGALARDTIELLCKILTENGMSKIEAETLRKAKFDKPEACAPLWQLLLELILFCQHGRMGRKGCSSHITMTAEDKVHYVKREMQKRGYLSRRFAELSVAMTGGSREVLLAMAWLLNRESVLTGFMDLRSAPVSDDVLALYQSEGGEEVVQGVGWGEGGGVRSAVQRVQQMLVLNSRLKMRLRLLHASQQHWANLTHKIHNSTYGVSLNPEVQHLSTMQTYMLRHPQHSVKVLWLLEKDSGRLENLLTWEEKNAVFWEWMGSVLELKLQQMYSQSTEGEEDRGAPDTRTIFLDLPPNLGLQIASSRRQLMEKILHYESVLNRLEDLWESKRHTVSEWDLDHLLQDINAQICRLQASLGQPRPHTSPTPPTPPLTLVKKAPPGPQGSVVRVSNAMTAARQERELQSDTRSLQEEIDRLQEEADRLEGDLVSVRQQCVTQLTAMMTAALPNTVCILPPHLRSSLAS